MLLRVAGRPGDFADVCKLEDRRIFVTKIFGGQVPINFGKRDLKGSHMSRVESLINRFGSQSELARLIDTILRLFDDPQNRRSLKP